MRGDLGDAVLLVSEKFQFTPLHEGRQSSFDSYMWQLLEFQFTPLREGRPGSTAVLAAIAAFQFTPLREGRL